MSCFKQLLLKLLHKTKRMGPCEYFVFVDLFEQQFGHVPEKTEKGKRKEKQKLEPSSYYSASMPSTLPISKIKQVTSETCGGINRARPWTVWAAGGLTEQYWLNTRAWGRSPVQSTHWRQMSTMPHHRMGPSMAQGKHSVMVASFHLPPSSPCVQHS